jgi:DNA-binding beta-propeller fold protein YncE
MGIAVSAGGDIFVGDVADDGTGVIIQIDPVTGAQSVAVQGLPFAPASIAIEADGDLVISDGLFGVPIVLRVDPRTGARTTLSSGGLLFDPFGVAVEPGGDIIVGDVDAFGFEGAVFRIDPITGRRPRCRATAPSSTRVRSRSRQAGRSSSPTGPRALGSWAPSSASTRLPAGRRSSPKT